MSADDTVAPEASDEGKDPSPDERYWIIPEVVQTSAMDCGPAALKALLEGFGIAVSYPRLREACQTSVDGTSIDTIEQIAVQLGLEAEQMMLPADHLLLPEAGALPALVVMRLPNGFTHFVVVWRRHGGLIQVMDPGGGRRWVRARRLLDELFIHTVPIDAALWREWAGGTGMLAPLRRRLTDLQLAPATIDDLLARALADEGWRGLATLDAATRMLTALVRGGGLRRGLPAEALLTRVVAPPDDEQPSDTEGNDVRRPVIPAPFWSVRPVGTGADGQDELLLRGVVALHVSGRRALADAAEESGEALPPALAAALSAPAPMPLRTLVAAMRQDGLLTPALLLSALLLGAMTTMIEILLLQGLIWFGPRLPLIEQRVTLFAALLFFLLARFALSLSSEMTIARMGRRLEARLRLAFLSKIPRLGDRYFHSRLTSDMAQRAHDLRQIHQIQRIGADTLRQGCELLLTLGGIFWLSPAIGSWVLLLSAAFVVVGGLAWPVLQEGDMRLRTLNGTLSRFYLDGLRGLTPLRTHGAERAARREFEDLLTQWARASLGFLQLRVLARVPGGLLFLILVTALAFQLVGGAASLSPLLFYWTLKLPLLAGTLFQQLERYPWVRNTMLRLLEPLTAPEEEELADAADHAPLDVGVGGVAITLEEVTVQAGGRTILHELNLGVAAGEHLVIVGPSGAGKSSLAGLLLGWHTPASGRCLVDGEPLSGARIAGLRRVTAWLDPAVQLWNHSLLENLAYGNRPEHSALSQAVEQADLFAVLERLPNGLQTPLGEGGGLVSGGEGQRVRFGRALGRESVRLVILDEPFRGLDREQRHALLARARAYWRDATLICITHDVGATRDFGRVLVIEEGAIIEDGPPEVLASRPDSRYGDLLAAEEQARRGLWQGPIWRHIRIADGQLSEQPTDAQSPSGQGRGAARNAAPGPGSRGRGRRSSRP
ncbi:ATP-binding cassette domain-containing protein [Candidatus Chloroploca sp. Khr17]|uniref:ATP-binding cassette domain-containing protein n=1 Tax=Candidatus Chloroploca sp. Khr17 TaxID=2496869 RepID=UPI00101C8593|nr:ATP-binding cassette domain-containing protein [Candidatus Chloroploca sp. Khr17]